MARSTVMLIAGAVALLMLTRSGNAGIADSPLPVRSTGATTLHLYSGARRYQRNGARDFLLQHVDRYGDDASGC